MKIKDDYHIECSLISKNTLRAQNTTGDSVKSAYVVVGITKVHTTFYRLYDMSAAEYLKRR